jgi:hypothetical protein
LRSSTIAAHRCAAACMAVGAPYGATGGHPWPDFPRSFLRSSTIAAPCGAAACMMVVAPYGATGGHPWPDFPRSFSIFPDGGTMSRSGTTICSRHVAHPGHPWPDFPQQPLRLGVPAARMRDDHALRGPEQACSGRAGDNPPSGSFAGNTRSVYRRRFTLAEAAAPIPPYCTATPRWRCRRAEHA